METSPLICRAYQDGGPYHIETRPFLYNRDLLHKTVKSILVFNPHHSICLFLYSRKHQKSL